MLLEIRSANTADFESIIELDPLAHEGQKRVEFIRRSLRSARCLVAVADRKIVGYAVMDSFFFDYPFISILFVDPQFRRQGIGSAFVGQLEKGSTGDRLFASTNQSNEPAQALFGKLGFIRSGRIDNLDEGDPELIYFKQLETKAG